jgi:hypothetical protein
MTITDKMLHFSISFLAFAADSCGIVASAILITILTLI